MSTPHSRTVLVRLGTLLATVVALVAAGLVTAAPATASGIHHGQTIKVGKRSVAHGDFRTCTSWQRSPRKGTALCSASYTMKNRVYGSVGVSNSKLSAKLGFDVTARTTARASLSVDYRRGDRGRIQVRPVYWKYPVTKTVTHCNYYGTSCHRHTTRGHVWKFRGDYNYRTFINGKRVA